MKRTAPRTRASVAPSTDRRFRRADLPIDRRRRGWRGLWRTLRSAGTALAVAAALVWGGVALAGSNAFLVRDLVVSGNVRLPESEIESLVDGLRGENILHVDLDGYADRIRESAWVADVRLSRVLPATIEIRIFERQPMVIARSNQRLYLVDDTGIIIDEYSAAYRGFDLPVVDGLLTAPAQGERIADPERVRLTRDLLTAFEGQPDVMRRFSQIDVSDRRDARLLFDDDPAWLHLGQERFGERLQTYLELRPRLLGRFEAIDYVDLRFEERVFVKGKPDGAARVR